MILRETQGCPETSDATILIVKEETTDDILQPSCDACHMGFDTHSQLILHTKTNKSCRKNHTRLYICTVCGVIFKKKRDLKVHESNHEGGVEYELSFSCKLCGDKFSSECNLSLHEKEHEQIVRYNCGLCNKYFKTEKNLDTHLKWHEKARFNCPFCEEKFLQRKRYQKHAEESHAREIKHSLPRTEALSDYECITCHKYFLNLAGLQHHQLIEHSDTPAICKLCNLTFKKVQYLKEHHNKVHLPPTYRFQCDICAKVYKQKHHLKDHMDTHTEGKNLRVCQVCGKTLTKTGMFAHMRMHDGVRNHVCTFCGMSFVLKGSLKKHELARHSDEKPFECELCGKRFAYVGLLNMHKRYHKEPSFSCEDCGRKFKTRSDLKDHRVMHSDERPFACHCGKSFKKKDYLKQHYRTHRD